MAIFGLNHMMHAWQQGDESMLEAYMVANAVGVDGIVDQQYTAGIVQSQRPKGSCWERKRKGDGVAVAC